MGPRVTNFNSDNNDPAPISFESKDDTNLLGDYFDEGQKQYFVDTPSGGRIPVMTQAEADHYENMREQYFKDNKIENVSDKLELDRVLLLEIASYRYSVWIGQGVTYQNGPLDPKIDKTITDLSKEIRELKKTLGIDKQSRDMSQGEGFGERWDNILKRAKEFGIHRNNQYAEAMRILNGIFAKTTLYYNSNEEEQVEFDATPEKILEWVREQNAIYDEIDKSFQQNQKMWIEEIN